MKMITRDSDLQYLNELQIRLEQNGIPSVIQGQETARMIVPRFLLQPTLWVYVDEQLDDALQLIENPEYIVKNRIDMDDLHEIQSNKQQNYNELNAVFVHMLLFAVAIMFAMFLLIKVIEKL